MQKKIIILLSVVVLICVVGLFFVVGGRNIENTMAKNSDNLSSVETVNVGETLKAVESVESSTEVPSVDTSEVQENEELLTNVLEETGSNVNFDRGESKGEAIINKVETEKTEEANTVGQGGDKSLLEELQQAENKEDLPWDLQMEQNGGEYVSSTADQYFVKSADGSYEFTPEFIAIVQESAFGKGATIEQITDYFNKNSDLLVDLEFDYLEGFIELLEAMGSYKTLVPQPSTSTTTANNNTTTTPSTSGNTSSSGGSTSSTNNAGGSTGSSTGSTSNSSGSLPAGWIPDDQLPPRSSDDGESTGGVARDGRGDGSGTGPLTSNIGIE